MGKAVISNRIYMDKLSHEELKRITESLTYKLETASFTSSKGKSKPKVKVEYLRNYKLLPNSIISIPQGRSDLIPTDSTIIDKRVMHEVPFPEPLITLRDSQQDIYDKVVDSCFINAKVGWGKTFMALVLAAKLGQKTLVVTHTVGLRDQWIHDAKVVFGMDVGVIGSGIFDIEDHFIVIGNIQSLSKYKTKIIREFGTLILDEAHHVPATTFTDIVDSMYARYRIGLSGTMERRDGRDVLLTDFFSNNVYKPDEENTETPIVNILKPGVWLDPTLAWAAKMNKLLYDTDYQCFIADLARMQVLKGHTVLVIASRVEFLQNIKDYLGEDCMLVTGTTSTEERREIGARIESGEITCIAGSRQIFSEGISINQLSAVILAEPMSFEGLIEQIIGRVRRKAEDKLKPEVFDINFSDPASRKQNDSRLAFYLNSGWEINRC